MTYAITTEPIEAGAGEGAISEAIETAVGDKDLGDSRKVIDAAKHAVHGLLVALDPDVTSYRITINGVHRKGKNKPSFTLSIQVLEHAEPEADPEE